MPDGRDSSDRITTTIRISPEVWSKVGFIAESYRWPKNTAVEEMLKKAAGMRNLIDVVGKGGSDAGLN